MALGALDHDGRALLGGQPDEALADGELHTPDGLAVQADGGRECEAREIRLDQVDRTHVRVETLGDELDHVLQRLVEIVRARDDLGDIGEEGDPIRNGRFSGVAIRRTSRTTGRAAR
jgi:hypothetical protein